jgi:hypothetical protein
MGSLVRPLLNLETQQGVDILGFPHAGGANIEELMEKNTMSKKAPEILKKQ